MTGEAPGPGAAAPPDASGTGVCCARCGYPFSGRVGACPECGTHVDPADPATIALGRRGRVLRLLVRPPGLPMAAAAAAAGLVTAYGFSVPGLYIGPAAAGITALAMVVGAWALRATAAVIGAIIRGEGWQPACRRLGHRRWWAAPAIAVLLAAASGSGLATWIGWRLRMGQLAPMAEAWRVDPRSVAGLPGSQHVATGEDGLPRHPLDLWFPPPQGVQPTRESDAGLVVRVPGTGFLFEHGVYVHAPTMAADSPLRPHLRALGDGWYAGRIADF